AGAPAGPRRAPRGRLRDPPQRLRANSTRLAERLQRSEVPGDMNLVAEAATTAPIAPGAPAPIEAHEDVTIRPLPPKPTLFIEQPAEQQPVAHEAHDEAAFIPPQ